MLQKAGKRANKHWGKMKAAIKIRQAMKQVHQESKKKLKEDRDAIHNDIVKFFKTRLQKGDKLLAKTVTMGYDFGDLKSHVSEMYRPSGKVRFFFDVLVFFTMILSFYTSTYLFAFVPGTLNVSESFILYWAEVIYILDAIHLSIVVYHSRHQPASNYTVEDLDLLENMKRYLIIHFLAAELFLCSRQGCFPGRPADRLAALKCPTRPATRAWPTRSRWSASSTRWACMAARPA